MIHYCKINDYRLFAESTLSYPFLQVFCCILQVILFITNRYSSLKQLPITRSFSFLNDYTLTQMLLFEEFIGTTFCVKRTAVKSLLLSHTFDISDVKRIYRIKEEYKKWL